MQSDTENNCSCKEGVADDYISNVIIFIGTVQCDQSEISGKECVMAKCLCT